MAVWPPAPVLDALSGLPRPALESLRWSTRDQWHVTLRFFGELADAAVDEAARILRRQVEAHEPPTRARGGPGTRVMGARLVVWPVEGLADLAGAVEAATAGLGEPLPHRPFKGHITLARGRGGADLRAWRQDLAHPLASSWEVRSVALVRSQLGPTGARYTELARFDIGGSGCSPAAGLQDAPVI